MAEDDFTVPASTMVPLINAQQIDHASKYHTFKYLSVNYVLYGKVMPKPKLSRTELMVGHSLIDWQHEMWTGLGKFKDEILAPIEVKLQDIKAMMAKKREKQYVEATE